MKKEHNNGMIYRVVNTVNGNKYIGATFDSIEQRKLDHIERAKRGESNKFHDAIATYGSEAFRWEQIDTASSTDELAQKEKHYILEYKSKEHGYNSDAGGGFKKTVYQYNMFGGHLISKFDSLTDAAKTIDASKQDISRACLSVNKCHGGYYWSYKYMEPFIPDLDSRKKEVLQLSLDGHILATYVSASEASRQSGLSKTCITRCCRGERETSGGFIWKYLI